MLRLLSILVLLALLLPPAPRQALADPDYPGFYLYGLDPVITSTDDPRLLGIDRLVLSKRLSRLGVDPLRDADPRPSLYKSIRKNWQTKSRVDLVRIEEVDEFNGTLGLMTRIKYPTYFFLFPARQVLDGGFVYYPPRPVDDPVVDLFLDDLNQGQERLRAVDREQVWSRSLNVLGKGQSGPGSTDLLNLTIPIKLPRTLEKIIGRGEKTRIKISGREHISIGGESTVIKPFIPNERVQSQSYFPSLDMKQQLQVNLSGTIGEKIIIEVDHDSEAIGPEGTKIKLMYRGLEDEVIKTIEAGDVGLTLPNSNLLGYSSNKSGLFGVKVTGQVGRADFTVVASKQKAEASSKTFNSSGGTLEDNVFFSYQYLNNRFFYLDIPALDNPGAPAGYSIDPNSIYIYEQKGDGSQLEDDILNVAAYLDDTGTFWHNNNPIPPDFDHPYVIGERWRAVPFETMLDINGNLVAIDLRTQMPSETILAVAYRLTNGTDVIKVGDIPGQDDNNRYPINGVNHYRMKLLKAQETDKEPYTFQYVLRNIYPLGGARIDPETFELRIERAQQGEAHPELDENGIPYLRIFGLDNNDGRGGGPDGIADKNDPYLFDLENGLLKFPLNFPQPFAADSTTYTNYAGEPVWGGFLAGHMAPDLYDPEVLSSYYNNSGYFKIIASHASAASSFSLGASNIEEGSETVTLDGRTLQRGTDYEIDYTFGQITLKGDNAILTPSSKISVNFSYAPFVGGGNTSLIGFNLGYDIGRDSKMSTTWLYQAEAIVGKKAKLGEEPNRMIVGNINFQHTFKPYALTHVANFLSRRNSERESRVQLSGELAVSLPNPNTMDRVYLEDFEGVDASDVITLTRGSWFWASAPVVDVPGTTEKYDANDRVPAVRWFLDRDRVLRRYLNPDLEGQERDETQQAMDLFLHTGTDTTWGEQSWGGIMRGISRTGLDLSRSQFLEFWVNDKVANPEDRSGNLHIDFGYISEDGFWKKNPDGTPITGTWEREDGINSEAERDYVWTQSEDVGLDGNERGTQLYDASYTYDGTTTLSTTGEELAIDYPGPDTPYPGINGTARNNREDTEDLNGNTRLDQENTYFSAVIALADSALIDVLRDYPASQTDELAAEGQAWRKYRIRLSDVVPVAQDAGDVPNIEAVTHIRIWYEDSEGDFAGRKQVHLQLSDLRFLGSRWEREGIRLVEDESLLTPAERGPTEEFYLGEANNKENPDYQSDPPPFEVPVLDGIEEKEQSIVLDVRDLAYGHMIRAGKQVSPRGDDYTRYRDMSWYWYNQSEENKDLDLFLRVGSDTLNYYEVDYRYNESAAHTGWKAIKINMAELANVKTLAPDGETGIIHSTIPDVESNDRYRVRVVGQPDLREVKKYFFGVVNDSIRSEASGFIYLNDIKLEGVKRDMGLAQRAGLTVNMADVLKVSFDWQSKDAEFHGLDAGAGSGVNFESWNFSTNFSVDDYIPLLGFQLPVQLSKSRTTRRPKYQTNSDIEIFDEAVQDSLSAIDNSEQFTSRLRHSPSKAVLMRYLVDPWQLTVSGSRQSNVGPLERRNQKNLQGSLNYDLRIPGRKTLGGLPLLEKVPVVRNVALLPEKIEGSASFTSTYNASVAIDLDGSEIPRATVKRRPGVLKGQMDYKPYPLLNLSISGDSQRDLLVENKRYGVNLGLETQRKYTTRATFLAPKAKDIPAGKAFYPLRQAVRGLNELRPSLQFTGSFNDSKNPQQLQPDDPPEMHSISNDGSWDFRFSLPFGDAVKKVWPEKKYSHRERDRLVEEQRRREQQSSRRPGSGGNPGTSPAVPDDPNLTPEERQRLEDERLLADAENRLREERERRGDQEDTSDSGSGETKGPRLKIPNPLNVVGNTLRNTNPIKVTVSQRRSSAFGRTTGMPTFWYLSGLQQGLDIPDSLVNVFNAQERKSLSMSTSTKIVNSLSLDVKYSTDRAETERIGSITRDYKQDWPDAQISLSGMEKWRLLGGKPGKPNEGWLRGSNISVSYKRSKNVTGMTEVSYNPRTSVTLNPRWTFNFQNGMTATLTSSLANEKTVTNGSLNESDRVRYGLQLKHQFRAQRLLAKMGLYRPGANPTITMDVDISYLQNKSVRTNPGSEPSAATGTRQYGVTPRFTYQISRNLTSGLNLGFNRTMNLATEQSTTRVSMGMEVTFVF